MDKLGIAQYTTLNIEEKFKRITEKNFREREGMVKLYDII